MIFKSKYFVFEIYLLIIILEFISNKGLLDFSHELGSELKIQVGSISSLNGIIPFSYEKLQICGNQNIEKVEDTLGEIFTGEKKFNTGYIANTGNNSFCQVLCYNQFTTDSVNLIQTLINKNYFINWYLDNLPAVLKNYNIEFNSSSFDLSSGIPLGYIYDNNYYIYNHYQFHILINEKSRSKYNIVGFQVVPLSIKHDKENPKCAKSYEELNNNYDKDKQKLKEESILFTYDVIFENSTKTFAYRWDFYKPKKTRIHWYGISISEFIIMSLTLIIFFFFLRNIKVEINEYNHKIVNLEVVDYYTWKELSGDVFRAPTNNPMLLSAIIGNGFQLFCVITLTLILGIFEILDKRKKVNFLNIGIVIFCLMGLPGGYISSKIYQFFKGKEWVKNGILTSLIFPGILFSGFFLINIILLIEKSSAAFHFTDLLGLFSLWIFFTCPLILFGSFLGFKSKEIKAPCRTNPIPSYISNKPWYLHYKFMIFFTGFISFGAFFIELNYVMNSLWRHQIYFLATFLLISFILFVLICVEISIMVIFMNLCYGDYNWWWKSFLIGASPVIYFILFSIVYFFKLKITGFSGIVVYFGIMGLISTMSLFICGSISVLVTFLFVKFIYSKIKID
jgi:transmembrane 9 superfamily protein 2/4